MKTRLISMLCGMIINNKHANDTVTVQFWIYFPFRQPCFVLFRMKKKWIDLIAFSCLLACHKQDYKLCLTISCEKWIDGDNVYWVSCFATSSSALYHFNSCIYESRGCTFLKIELFLILQQKQTKKFVDAFKIVIFMIFRAIFFFVHS